MPKRITEPDENGVFLSDVSSRDEKWDKAKANACKLRDAYKTIDYLDLAERINNCAGFLKFAYLQDPEGTSKLKLREARFCHVRLCPVCSWRRSLMWFARFAKALPKIEEVYPNHHFLFLTLTVKNCEPSELRQTLSQMNKAWNRLVQRKMFPAIGWARSAEVTKGKDGSAHPHFHVLLMVPPSYFSGATYVSHAKWTELWQSTLKIDYIPIVNIKRVKVKDGNFHAAICEVFKYQVKPSDIVYDSDWLEEITKQLHKTRSVAIGGVFKDYINTEEPEDLIHTDLEDEESSGNHPEFWFGWREKFQKYQSM